MKIANAALLCAGTASVPGGWAGRIFARQFRQDVEVWRCPHVHGRPSTSPERPVPAGTELSALACAQLVRDAYVFGHVGWPVGDPIGECPAAIAGGRAFAREVLDQFPVIFITCDPPRRSTAQGGEPMPASRGLNGDHLRGGIVGFVVGVGFLAVLLLIGGLL